MSTDFVDNSDNILKILGYTEGDYPSGMGEGLSSSEYNSNMSIIELRLNVLYQKIKYMQELVDYTKNYVISEIKNRNEEFKEKLKIISEVTDIYRDQSSVAQIVYLTQCSEQITDRDGSVVKPMIISDKKLVPPGNTVSSLRINSIVNNSSAIKYSSNYENLKNGEAGSAIYLSDNIMAGGLDENVNIQFDEGSSINYIDIPVINGDIATYEITYTNDSKKEITPLDKYIEAADIKEILIKIKSRNYTEINQQVSKEKRGSIFDSTDDVEPFLSISSEKQKIIQSSNESEIYKT